MSDDLHPDSDPRPDDEPMLSRLLKIADIDHLGLVLIAHGSRHPSANSDLFELAERLRQAGLARVYPSFLELAEPTIESAADHCMAAGATCLVLVPYFLSSGRHVEDDLKLHRDRVAKKYPRHTVHLARPLGPHIFLDQIVLQRILETIE